MSHCKMFVPDAAYARDIPAGSIRVLHGDSPARIRRPLHEVPARAADIRAQRLPLLQDHRACSTSGCRETQPGCYQTP